MAEERIPLDFAKRRPEAGNLLNRFAPFVLLFATSVMFSRMLTEYFASREELGLTYFLLAALFAEVVALLIYYRRKSGGELDVFEPIYPTSAYFILLFVVRALYDFYFGSMFMPKNAFKGATLEAFDTALIYLMAAYFFFYAGYCSGAGAFIASKIPSIPATWSDEKFKSVAPVIFAAGLGFNLILFQMFGGFSYYVSHKAETLTAGGQEYILLGTSLLQYLFGISLTRTFGEKKGRIFTFAGLAPALLFLGLISGSKGTFLLPFVFIMMSSHYLKRKIRIGNFLAVVLIVMITMPVFGVYRYTNDVRLLAKVIPELARSGESKLIAGSLLDRFEGIDSLTYIIRDTPGAMDFQLGGTITPLFVAWMPRAFWDEKPIVSFGKVFAETYYRQFYHDSGTAASPTILGDAYINFHFGGMLWMAMICGILIRACYEHLIMRNFGGPAVSLYCALFIIMAMFWEGNIAATTIKIMEILAPMTVLILLMSKRGETEGR